MNENSNAQPPRPQTRATARVLLVEDHVMLRNGFRQFMASRGDLELAGEASTGAEALNKLAGSTPDLLVIDVHLPDIQGLELAARLLEQQPQLKILVFSGDNDPSLVESALKTGVHGYVLKSSALEELSNALAAILDGKLYFSPEICGSVLEDYRKVLTQQKEQAPPKLSEQDRRLLQMIAKGARSKEIALEFGLSVKSIEAYRSRLMKRLSCRSVAELVCLGVREGLIVP